MDEQLTIRESDVQGVKYLNQVLPLLGRLHNVGCQRDKAGNRQLPTTLNEYPGREYGAFLVARQVAILPASARTPGRVTIPPTW